jgi:hypothetical protein
MNKVYTKNFPVTTIFLLGNFLRYGRRGVRGMFRAHDIGFSQREPLRKTEYTDLLLYINFSYVK